MTRTPCVLVALIALAGVAPAQAGESRPVALDLAWVHSDNVGRARFDIDRRSDQALELDLSTSFQPAWQTPGVLSFDLWAGADHYQRFDGLGQLRAGVAAVYRQRLGLGPEAPWWSLDGRLGWHDFRDDKRDGVQAQLGLSAGRSWDSGLALRGRVGYEVRDSRGGDTGFQPGKTFDLRGWHARLGLDYTSTGRWGLSAGIGLRRGEFNTSTRGSLGPIPWTHDDTFGAGFRTYRIDAEVTTLELGWQCELGPSTLLLAGAEWLDARARRGPATYDGTTLSLKVQHDF